ncbi:MAG: LON peptidase substrate-binding domain-containing protein, partial [Planctomycetota bacterium]
MKKAEFSFHKREGGTLPEIISIIPIKDEVIFPHLIRPLSMSEEGSVKAINESISKKEFIGTVALKYDVESPKHNDFYDVGTAVKIIQVIESSPYSVKVIVEGMMRIRITEYVQTEPYYKARVEELREFTEKSETVDVLVQSVKTLFKLSAILGKALPKDILPMIDNVNNPSILADLVAIYLELS